MLPLPRSDPQASGRRRRMMRSSSRDVKQGQDDWTVKIHVSEQNEWKEASGMRMKR